MTVKANEESSAEEEQIREIIIAYFETRYRSISTLKLENFESMVDTSPQGSEFFKSETEKLEIEIHHAELHQLRYLKYDYFIDFKDISINTLNQMATVSLVEGHDVIFEISEKITKSDPIVSSMRNLQHTIYLHQENGMWKIISDDYEDYLWRLLRTTGLSKEELLEGEIQHSVNDGAKNSAGFCNLPNDQSTHPYLRSLAVNYAHQWASAPRPYNPVYSDLTEFGGDCTNFISQAIHEGGDAAMVFGGNHGVGTVGWYYYNINDRATAWADVGKFYEFVTEYWVWPRPGIDDPDGPGGPEGCEVEFYLAYEGDIIQYDWTNDEYWDHGVIIVRWEDYGPDNRYHWVAGHTPDVDDYPYTSFSYEFPDMVYRFLHIDRIDGYSLRYIPLTMNNVSGMNNKMQYPNQNPYPAPGDTTPKLPYPPP